MLFLKKCGMTAAKTIVMLCGSAGFGALAVDIGMERYSPVSPPYFTKTRNTSASGCGNHGNLWWFNLAVEIQNQRHQLDKEETLFVANVINRLTSIDDVPTPDHAIWLCHLKQRLGL
jgi:hypothetical protein